MGFGVGASVALLGANVLSDGPSGRELESFTDRLGVWLLGGFGDLDCRLIGWQLGS